MILKSSYFF